jgi:hypothetical protein
MVIALTQRMADIAYRWFHAKANDLISYKKKREKVEQMDYDEIKQHILFSTLYYCDIKYVSMTYLEFIFGYRIDGKPDYFKKILFEMIYDENDVDFTEIKYKLDELVKKLQFCECCHNDNVAVEEYNNLCMRCYIYGTTNEDDCCAICLTNEFGIWIETDCHHRFHHRCYSKIDDNRYCPMCRSYVVDTKTLDY